MPDSRTEDILSTANELRRLVEQVTSEEFSWQDANYSRDSELGRELIYLIANNEWARATSENIDVTRRHAVDTTIRIDVDLDRITHEAFRHRTGRLWLPVFVLPPLKRQWPEPDPFGTMTVTDASGELLPILPGAEVRHRISAALAEIIVNMAASRLPKTDMTEDGTWPAATRDHRLLLSAAVYRLLRQGSSAPAGQTASARGQRRATTSGLSRLNTARQELGTLLSWYVDQPRPASAAPGNDDAPPAAPDAGGAPVAAAQQQDATATVRMLTERAVMVLRAFAELAIVVVAVRRDRTPAVLTLKLPSRRMRQKRQKPWRPRDPDTGEWRRPSTWTWLNWRSWNWLLPRAQLNVDLMLPSADADRQVRVDLPEGVSFDPSRPPVELEVRVSQPPPFGHLSELMSQLLDGQADRQVALQRSIADMAAVMADAASESMRDHLVAPAPGATGSRPADAGEETAAFYRKLVELRLRLDLPSDPDAYAEARAKLAGAWAGGEWLTRPLLRCTSWDLLGPSTVVAKANMIEDVSRRGAPTAARIHVHVAVTDADYFSIARFSSRMSALLMTVVLGFFVVTSLLGWQSSQVSAEVLAFVLTLFSAIQAGRIERSDRSTLHGVLSGAGSFLIVATVLPSVLLAVALAFSRSGWWPIGWAAGAIGLQLAIERLLNIRRTWEHGLGTSATPVAGGLFLSSEAPAYVHAEILHSGWWRGATANALLIGRPAYGYMIWQHDSSASLGDLLSGARPAKAEPAVSPIADGVHPFAEAVRPGAEAQPAAEAAATAAGLPAETGAGRFVRLGQWLQETGNRLQEGAHGDDLPATLDMTLFGDLRDAVPEDASVLALQRSGTASQSVTFVVFREEPGDAWMTKSHAIPVKLDPDQLGPIEDGIASVEIFAGLPRDRSLLSAAGHPVSRIVGVAADCRLFVLDAQLSVPAPTFGYSDLLWARVRVALHDIEIEHVGRFLDSVYQALGDGQMGSDGQLGSDGKPWDNGLVVAVRTVPEGPLRMLNPRRQVQQVPANQAQQAPGNLVLASDMDIMTAGPRSGEGPDEKAWRIIAICADARAGVESAIMRSLGSELRLAGLTYALLYGKAVFILVGQQGDRQAQPGRLSDRLADDRAGANVRVYLDVPLSRMELGVARPEPVLRMHVRFPDRAGVTLAVLDSLREMLPNLAPDGHGRVNWQVWYARVQISDGNTGLIMLTARLAVDPQVAERWRQSVFEDLARQVRGRTMSKAAGERGQTNSGFRAPEDTALTLRLITMPHADGSSGRGHEGAPG